MYFPVHTKKLTDKPNRHKQILKLGQTLSRKAVYMGFLGQTLSRSKTGRTHRNIF